MYWIRREISKEEADGECESKNAVVLSANYSDTELILISRSLLIADEWVFDSLLQ